MSIRSLPVSGVFCASSSIGQGLFAGRVFLPGEPLFQLKGEVMTLAGILQKGEAAANAFQLERDLYLYPTTLEGRFVNHSCNPNAGLREDRQMVALRTIQPGEEIRFDYSTCVSEQMWTMECRCGEPSCRGVIGDFHDLSPGLQERYVRLGVVQRFILNEIYERARRAVDGADVPAPRPATLPPATPANAITPGMPSMTQKVTTNLTPP
jgi:uncharacterized protein